METGSSANQAIGQSISAWPTRSVTSVTGLLRVVRPPAARDRCCRWPRPQVRLLP